MSKRKEGNGGAVFGVLVVGIMAAAVVLYKRGKLTKTLGKLGIEISTQANQQTSQQQHDAEMARAQAIRDRIEAESAARLSVIAQSGGVHNRGGAAQHDANITASNTFMYKGIGLTVLKYSTGEYYQVSASYNGTRPGYTRELVDGITLEPTPNCYQATDPAHCQLWNEIKAEIKRKIANRSLKPVVFSR